MNDNPDVSHQPDMIQQSPLVKKKSNLIWKVIFILSFLFVTKLSHSWISTSWNFDIISLLRVSFLLLPIVNLLLFIETFQKRLPLSFSMRIWISICLLLLISNSMFIYWLWQLYLSSLSTNFGAGTTVSSAGIFALPLAITDFIAGLFYIIQEQPQGTTRFILIAFLTIVSFVGIIFGVLGFQIIEMVLLAK